MAGDSKRQRDDDSSHPAPNSGLRSQSSCRRRSSRALGQRERPNYDMRYVVERVWSDSF